MDNHKDINPSDGAALSEAHDPALLCLNELLQFPPVEVPATFTDTVMQRVKSSEALGSERVQQNAGSRNSWIVAGVGAAAILAAIVLLGGFAGEQGSGSVMGTLASAFSGVVLAGAGMLSASWQGVGNSVGSWLGTSPTVGALVALAFVGSVLAFAGGLRRARQRSQSK